MTSASLDVVGIGNAIVDVIAHAEDAFLAREGLVKGTMTLIDAARAEALYRMMGPAIEASGGSAGNTMAGLASLGGTGAYIGKVRDDFLGQVFRHDITAIGVRFDTPAATSGPGTARCLILVTPDGQRTMNTYLGACVELGPADIDPDIIAAARITYLEGYLFDPPQAQEAFRKAAAIAHAAGPPGGAQPLRPVLRRAPSRRVPRPRRRPCRYPLRQRGRDLLALRDGRFRRRRGRGARACRDRRADPQRGGQRGPGRRAPSIASRRRRSRASSTPPGRAISTPAVSSTA